MEYLSALLSFIIILVLTYTHQLEKNEWSKERRELYDRIQAKDLVEFKEVTAVVEEDKEEQPETIVDLYSPEAIADLQDEESR